VNWSAGTLALVPPVLVRVTATAPVAVAAGETAVIDVGELTVKLFAAALPKLTLVTVGFSKFRPVILTFVPPATGPFEGASMAPAKPRDRGVVRPLVGCDHAVGDILHARALDPARGALTLAVGVEQERQHHRRIMRRAPMATGTIGTKERRDIHLLNSRQNEPREMIRRQPLPQVRRKQQLLIPVTSNEVLGHTSIVLNPPDSTPFTQQPPS
jgi:hypothetical protein